MGDKFPLSSKHWNTFKTVLCFIICTSFLQHLSCVLNSYYAKWYFLWSASRWHVKTWSNLDRRALYVSDKKISDFNVHTIPCADEELRLCPRYQAVWWCWTASLSLFLIKIIFVDPELGSCRSVRVQKALQKTFHYPSENSGKYPLPCPSCSLERVGNGGLCPGTGAGLYAKGADQGLHDLNLHQSFSAVFSTC